MRDPYLLYLTVLAVERRRPRTALRIWRRVGTFGRGFALVYTLGVLRLTVYATSGW